MDNFFLELTITSLKYVVLLPMKLKSELKIKNILSFTSSK